jgi:hypothetical protein
VFQHTANAQQTCELAPDPAFFPQIRTFAGIRAHAPRGCVNDKARYAHRLRSFEHKKAASR